MKKLILVRHAKSDWSQNVSDFDRPLNHRGHKDAPKMAKFLSDQKIEIQQLISSPAKRAFTTCQYFAEVYNTATIVKEENLYEPSSRDFLKTILGVNDESETVALFSHNFGISDFASLLTQNRIQFPTCGVAIFEINCSYWSEFEGADKKLLHFYVPKEI